MGTVALSCLYHPSCALVVQMLAIEPSNRGRALIISYCCIAPGVFVFSRLGLGVGSRVLCLSGILNILYSFYCFFQVFFARRAPSAERRALLSLLMSHFVYMPLARYFASHSSLCSLLGPRESGVGSRASREAILSRYQKYCWNIVQPHRIS